MSTRLNVLVVGTTLTPLAKVGGLADVMESLPKALYRLGISVRVLMPYYRSIDAKKFNIKKHENSIKVLFNKRKYTITLYVYRRKNAPDVFLIKNDTFFGFNGVYPSGIDKKYGLPKDAVRFSFFSACITTVLSRASWKSEVVHLNDWHTGLVPFLLKVGDFSSMPKTVFTIHNLAYQGVFPVKKISSLFNLPPHSHNPKTINFLQEGIRHADIVTTVSKTYAKEILTKKFGEGLSRDLKSKKSALYGILNGIDTSRFSPGSDPFIFKKYKPTSTQGKGANKRNLQKTVGLEINPDIPLFGMVSRLAEQKGLDILLPALLRALSVGGSQFIVLGTGNPSYEKKLQELALKYKKGCAVITAFDAALAKKIYAGSDFFLMPSRFEPSGLGQMISMRYGTLPLVHAVGGLKETVTDPQSSLKKANGISFNKYSSTSLSAAIGRASNIFHKKQLMKQLIKNASLKKFSWDISAKEYIRLYKKLAR